MYQIYRINYFEFSKYPLNVGDFFFHKDVSHIGVKEYSLMTQLVIYAEI